MRAWSVVIITLGLPALELVGIYLIWQRIGVWTLFWLAGAVVIGIWLLRREHQDFMPRLVQSVMNGHTPLSVMLASFRRVLAGLLLIFPGVMSDFLALILLLWPGGRPPRRPPTQASTREGETVIEGEYRRLD